MILKTRCLSGPAFERVGAGEMTLVHFSDGDAAVRYLGGQLTYDSRSDSPTPTMMLLDIKLLDVPALKS